MNVFNFTGNLGRDAETRYTPSGEAVVNFTVAVTSGYGDKAITTWVNCNLWGKRGEAVSKFLLKGQQVGVSGELTNRPYQKDGIEKYSLEVRVNDVTLLGKKDGATSTPQRQDAQSNEQKPSGFDDFDDDIPF